MEVMVALEGSRRSLLRQDPRREQWHRAPGRAFLLAFLPRDARDVQMRPVVLAGELGEKARGGDAAAGAVADVGEIGEVAVERLVVILPHRQLPGSVERFLASVEQGPR